MGNLIDSPLVQGTKLRDQSYPITLRGNFQSVRNSPLLTSSPTLNLILYIFRNLNIISSNFQSFFVFFSELHFVLKLKAHCFYFYAGINFIILSHHCNTFSLALQNTIQMAQLEYRNIVKILRYICSHFPFQN